MNYFTLPSDVSSEDNRNYGKKPRIQRRGRRKDDERGGQTKRR
jgi:hypothetical protein